MITAYCKSKISEDLLFELFTQFERPIQIKNQKNNKYLIKFKTEEIADTSILVFNEILLFSNPLKLKKFELLDEQQIVIQFKKDISEQMINILKNLTGTKVLSAQNRKLIISVQGTENYIKMMQNLQNMKQSYQISSYF